nr:ABC transporter ATP-binding protein [Arachnia propionica]
MNAIELQQLRKTFRSPSGLVEAVSGIDVVIEPGEVVAFLGPNGAGKTTTLDMVLGLTGPTSGTARVCDLKPREAIRQGMVGAVLQTGGLLRDMSVGETIRAIAALQDATSRIGAVMSVAGLERIAPRRVSRCSGGEQQRIKFALALLTDPRVLILDEPTAGLDVTARRDFWEAMHQQAERGRTIVFATHYLEEAQNFADRIVLIAKGHIIADGTVDQIRALTSHRHVTALLPVDRADALVAELRPLLGRNATLEGSRLSVMVPDADALALALLQRGAHDLEVVAPSLEDAFLALTETR